MFLNTEKIIDSGSQGRIYETIYKKKKYVTKIPVSENEKKISNEMSEIVGPKIYNEKIKDRLSENYLIMEYLEKYVNLTYIIEDPEYYIEDDLSDMIIEKIKKIHKMGYCHNDLGTCNIMILLDDKKNLLDVKIIDYGRSKKISYKGEILNDYKRLIKSIEFLIYSGFIDKKENLLNKLYNRYS